MAERRDGRRRRGTGGRRADDLQPTENIGEALRQIVADAGGAAEAAPGRIAEDLRPLAVPVGDLVEHPDNARRHSERDIPILMESLRRYGQRKPVVAKREYRGLRNVVVAGNGTLAAARRLEWTGLAVAWFEGSDDEADEYALVDNRTAELSTWDLETLARQLRTVRDRVGEDSLERMGWAPHESTPLLQAEWRPAAPGHLPGREVSWRSVSLSLAQWLVLELAIQRVQESAGDPSMPEGRAVELLAAEFLGGDLVAHALDRPATEDA